MDEERRHLHLPDRRENTYVALEKKIDECFDILEDRFRSFFIKALIAFAVIGITSAVGLFGFAYVLGEVKDTREDFVREACATQNQRHSETVAAFNKAAADAIKKHPESEKDIRESTEANLTIIDALAPVQDCEYLIKLSVGDATPTPAKKKP